MKLLDCHLCGADVKVDNRIVQATCWHCVIETMWGAAPKTEKNVLVTLKAGGL